MDHEQTMRVNSKVLDQKQQNIFDRISLFWSEELPGHPEQLNKGDHDWLIQRPVSTVQPGMQVQPYRYGYISDMCNRETKSDFTAKT